MNHDSQLVQYALTGQTIFGPSGFRFTCKHTGGDAVKGSRFRPLLSFEIEKH